MSEKLVQIAITFFLGAIISLCIAGIFGIWHGGLQ